MGKSVAHQRNSKRVWPERQVGKGRAGGNEVEQLAQRTSANPPRMLLCPQAFSQENTFK